MNETKAATQRKIWQKKKLNLDSEGKKKVSKQLKRGQKGKYYEENV